MRKHFALLIIALLSLPVIAKEPVGYYYPANGKKGEALKTALHNVISQAHTLKYGGGAGYTWEGFYSTDRIESNNKVWDMYSNDTFYQKSFSSIVGMHIEHSLPKSWWGAIENNAYKDLFHLYPSEGNINIRKSNLPLGETDAMAYTNGVSRVGINTFGDTYTERSFEPADEYKGDFARSYLYMSTAYENLSNNWESPMMDKNTYPVWKKWAIDLLLKWHRQDPVSDKEIARIEKVYKIQGNRNPFIDYPDLVEYIWGNSTATPYYFPSETSAFIAAPSRWEAIKYDIVILNSVNEKEVSVLGSHLAVPLQLKLTGRYPDLLSISTNSLSATDVNNGTSIKINFKATSKVAVNDTLKMYSAEIDTIKVPISAIVSSEFMAINPDEITATSATLKWMDMLAGQDYKVSLYSGESDKAGDLFISVYLEGKSNNKAIEIYNATGKSVDLSNYSLKIQSNGNGNFGSEIALSGILENNKSFVIANKGEFGDAEPALIALSDIQASLSFNGNDAVALFHNHMQIDVVGSVNDESEWGKDITMLRKTGVPKIVYNTADWTHFEIDYFSALRNYSYIPPTTPATKLKDYTIVGNTLEVKELNPAQIYHYTVMSNNLAADNIVHFSTLPLAAPVALDAINVLGTEFQGSWDDVPGAKSYRFELSEMQGPGFTTEVTDFTGVGTNGKPMPEGWSGTASGNYATAASSGIAVPSIALKNNGEYITSKSFIYPIVSLTFMYRFPSAGAGNAIIVEGFKNDKWEKIDEILYQTTTKQYPKYLFKAEDNVTAIRITFRKAAGNLAIDDIEIQSGLETATTTTNDVNGLEYTPKGLKKLTRYIYRVQAIHPAYVSEYSNPITVLTTNVSSVTTVEDDTTLKITIDNGLVRVQSSDNNISNIALYSTMGQLLHSKRVDALTCELEVGQRGVYILDIEVANKHKSVKIIL